MYIHQANESMVIVLFYFILCLLGIAFGCCDFWLAVFHELGDQLGSNEYFNCTSINDIDIVVAVYVWNSENNR